MASSCLCDGMQPYDTRRKLSAKIFSLYVLQIRSAGVIRLGHMICSSAAHTWCQNGHEESLKVRKQVDLPGGALRHYVRAMSEQAVGGWEGIA